MVTEKALRHFKGRRIDAVTMQSAPCRVVHDTDYRESRSNSLHIASPERKVRYMLV